MSIRVLLADDHRMFLEGLAGLLGREPDIEIVARAHDGREAVKAALELVPDVVAMDLSMPRLAGVEATRQIVTGRPEVAVVCLSMHRDRHYLKAALEAGASGYVLKDCASEDLVVAIRRAAAGATYLCREMRDAAVAELRSSLTEARPAAAPTLTPREREVLQLVAEGATSQQIAAALFVSERTIATHRRNLAEKLGIHSVAGLTKYAIRTGLTTLERDPSGGPDDSLDGP